MDDDVILGMVLATGNRSETKARAAAARALADTGGLLELARCDERELSALVGEAGARRLTAAFALGLRRAALERAPPKTFASSADVAAWAERLVPLEHEELWVLALDGRGGLRAARRAAQGGLHGLGVRAADVLRIALRAGAGAFVLVHNHPSGDPTPSEEDRVFTRSIAGASVIVGLPLLDHVVVARGGFSSVPVDPAEPAEARSA